MARPKRSGGLPSLHALPRSWPPSPLMPGSAWSASPTAGARSSASTVWGRAATSASVPDAELQRLGDRPYFKTITGLSAGQVYVALVNAELQPNTDLPAAPTLWVAAPVLAADGKPFGFLSVAIDLRPAFARVLEASPDDGAIFIVSEQGEFLAARDQLRASPFDPGGTERIQDELPLLAPALSANEWPARIMPDRAATRFGVALAPVRLAEGRRIDVIELVPRARIMTAANAARDASLLAGLVAVLGAIVLAILLARSLTRPLAQITAAADSFTGTGTIQVPTDASGEVGVLARSFARMAKEVQNATARSARKPRSAAICSKPRWISS